MRIRNTVREEFLGEEEDNAFCSDKNELAKDMLEECEVDPRKLLQV